MFNHGRHGAFATAVVMALALLIPSLASAHHDLVIYKAEAHVDLESDEKTVSVSCDPGDHALDGMWRIDHADQDDYVPYLELITSAVDVLKATPTSDSTYSFSFVKNAIGRAQVKIFVTCLKGQTQGGSHQHSFVTGAQPNGSFFNTNATTPGFQTQTTPVVGGAGLLKTTISTPAPCPSRYVLVSPGFEALNLQDTLPAPADPLMGMMRIFESNSLVNPRNWTWKFENSALPAGYTMDIETKWRCLKLKVPQNGFDKHKLITKFKNPVTFKPKKNKVSEGQYNCGSHYKAIVAGFRIPENDGGVDVSNYTKTGDGFVTTPLPDTAFNHVYYLGMDPRPKQRAYRFANRHTANTFDVILTALCINYRTT